MNRIVLAQEAERDALETFHFYEARREGLGERFRDHLGVALGRFRRALRLRRSSIAIFAESYGELPDGRKVKHYYTQESVGIATGFLIAAIHHAGLVSLTHTPSPMGFLNQILGRPTRERPFLLLVVGYPADGATVPDITKKPLAQIATFV